jgi:hypothetical protein
MKLWLINIRPLAVVKSECKPFSVWIINRFNTEKETIKDLYHNKFTPTWWECYIIIDIEYRGEIWYEHRTNS